MSHEPGPSPVQPDPAIAAAAARRGATRNKWFIRLAVIIVIAAAGAYLYYFFVSSRRVTTDDAYVQADIAQVTALVSGAIINAPVGETQAVKKGQVVAQIDPSDFQLAVDRARAELNQAQRRVQQYFANDRTFAAQTTAKQSDIARAQAQIAAAQSNLAKAEAEAGRRRNLNGTGAISADEMTDAENRVQTARADLAGLQAALSQARANVTVADEQRKAAAVLIAGSNVTANPEVAVAQAKLSQAELDLARTVVHAPVDGLIAKNTIEVGQRVQAGASLMTVVPIHTAYVDANFKEVQLRKIHIGSIVNLTSDLYGKKVVFHGKVTGIAGGSGSAFSLIPAQNATGNWIKVVQRVPVRISLDPKELEQHPLRVGLSMKADVDVVR
jgi:membrane fusion protein (multidrug efflux system)